MAAIPLRIVIPGPFQAPLPRGRARRDWFPCGSDRELRFISSNDIWAFGLVSAYGKENYSGPPSGFWSQMCTKRHSRVESSAPALPPCERCPHIHRCIPLESSCASLQLPSIISSETRLQQGLKNLGLLRTPRAKLFCHDSVQSASKQWFGAC